MAAARTRRSLTEVQRNDLTAKRQAESVEKKRERAELVAEQLPPLWLVSLILMCSGALMLFSLRDFLTTGKNIGGKMDEQLLLFTKSTDWYEGSRGWKSQQGGFSAIAEVSTDENNMGGFFVRKLMGGTGTMVHLHKLYPLLMHESGAHYTAGNFLVLFKTAVVANLCIIAFYASYYEDLLAAEAWDLPRMFIGVLCLETLVLFYAILCIKPKRRPAVAMKDGKTPESLVSNILTRTVLIVSSLIALVAARDLFLPGFIIDLIPRDDIYLEWTNALFHSPPPNSPEDNSMGLEAPLYIGDKFVSQLCALHLLLLCLYKFVSALVIRVRSDGSGTPMAKMIWKVSCLGDAATMACFRFFASAAKSASWDVRWHLVLLSYEMFIFGLYGFF